MIFEKPARRVDRVFLHCTASEDETLIGAALVRAVYAWHMARKFSGIGYHFLIDKRGQVMEGRNLERTPAAQEHHNLGTIAICVHGLVADQFTLPALAACLDLCDQINRVYDGKVSFHGHCEVSAKSCPVFDYRALLQLSDDGRMPLQFVRDPIVKPKGGQP